MDNPTRSQQPPGHRIYRCGDIVVEPRAHLLLRDAQPVPVEPKAYAVLLVLLERAGELVDKNALLDTVWGHRNVTPAVLSRVISQLRRALGDCAVHPHLIATVYCLGYRFIGPVQAFTAPGDAPAQTDHAGAGAGIERRALPDRRSPRDRRRTPATRRRTGKS